MTSQSIEIVDRVKPVGVALLLVLLMLPACAARHVRGYSARLGPNDLMLAAILNPAGIPRSRLPSDAVFVDFAVTTDPPGARVLVNGDSVGEAPAQVHHARAVTYGILNRIACWHLEPMERWPSKSLSTPPAAWSAVPSCR